MFDHRSPTAVPGARRTPAPQIPGRRLTAHELQRERVRQSLLYARRADDRLADR